MKHRKAPLLLAAGLGALLLAPQAQAFTMTFGKDGPAPYFDLGGDYNLPFNLNIAGGVGIAPSLGNLVPRTGSAATTDTNPLKFDADLLADVNLNLGYNIPLVTMDLGLGKLNATLTPYLGYRFMYTNTSSAAATLGAGGLGGTLIKRDSSLHGLNYGAKFNLGLPLGFSGYAYLGASSLFGGSTNLDGVSSPIDTKGTVLPRFGLGAAWNFPFFNLASVYLGYSGFFLPSDLRNEKDFTHGNVMVNGVSLGLNVLWFGI